VSNYAEGIICLTWLAASWIFVAWRVRIALLPSLAGAAARVAESIVALSGVLVTAEILGAFGAFHRVPFFLLGGLIGWVIGVAVRWFGPVRLVAGPRTAAKSHHSVAELGVAVAAVFVVSAQWFAGVANAYRVGILDLDSLNYHLPDAAYFVQTGTLWRTHEVSAGADGAFHPLNIELLHAIGMLALRSDFASLFINLGLLWLMLLAAWVVGERARAGPAAVAAAALLAAVLPLELGGGNGQNDIAVLAFLLAALGFADAASTVESRRERHALRLVAGLALGLALGTKLSAPGAVVALLVGWLWMWGSRRWFRHVWALVVPAAVTGLFWYIRDWALYGSPAPSVSLKIAGVGFSAVSMPVIAGTDLTVAHYLRDPQIIRHWFIPALHADFGWLWPLILALPLIGVFSACRPGRARVDRVIAAAAAFAFVFYLLTPSGAEGPPGQPSLFVSNVRYATPALILGLMALVRDPWLSRRRELAPALLALEVVMILPKRFWSGDFVRSGLAAAALCALIVAVVYLAWRTGTALALGALAVLTVLAAVAGFPLERHYLRNRYASTATPTQALFAWSRGLTDTRIGGVGFPVLYPFYGASFSNQVRYVGQAGAHHAFNDYASCSSWVSAVNAGRYQYIAVLPRADGLYDYPRFATWTGQAGGVLVFNNSAGSVFRIDRPLTARRCT
jgi:hypothetical protein